MARYLGPTCKLARRVGGVDLGLKSRARNINEKCKLTTPPGQHGGTRGGRASDYGLQLTEKQKIRHAYGLLERQFRRFYHLAEQKKGNTAENLMQLLESRLDVTVYRMGFAATIAEARQLVSHKGVTVNERVSNVPSFLVKPTDKVAIAKKAKEQLRIKSALALAEQGVPYSWLEVDTKKLEGVYTRLPNLDEWPNEFKVNLVIELYSK